MSIGPVLTLGLGAFTGGGVRYLPTLGYGTGGIPPTPPAVSTNTPGFIRNLRIPSQIKGEDEAEKLARRIREGTIPAPVAPIAEPVKPVELTNFDTSAQYLEKSARLAAGIARFRAEAEASRRAIARLERAAMEQQTAQARRDLIRAQQGLQLALVREAVLLEEMEVMDVAFFALVALRSVMQ